jgi:hypothetical protein
VTAVLSLLESDPGLTRRPPLPPTPGSDRSSELILDDEVIHNLKKIKVHNLKKILRAIIIRVIVLKRLRFKCVLSSY